MTPGEPTRPQAAGTEAPRVAARLVTAPARGGIAVIVLSGPGVGEILRDVFRPRGRPPAEGRLALGWLVDGEDLLDEAVVSLLNGGECAEINIHGGSHLARRVLAHAGAEKVTRHAGDAEGWMTWEAWAASSVHREIAEAAHALGTAGLLEDRVPLERYGSEGQVREVLGFLHRAALGEGMRSRLDPVLRVMGVTASGGGKVSVSPDPADGHVVPIAQLTWDGYIRAIPQGCPVDYATPSVEAHENGLVYLAGALVDAGEARDFDGFLGFLRDHFARNDRIDVLPEGMEPKVFAVEHFHRQPRRITVPDRAEVVEPDPDRFPEIDFPCGVREAELHLLSALFRSRAFRSRGRLEKVVVAVLPGHGCVALYGGPRQELIDVLVNHIEWEEVRRV